MKPGSVKIMDRVSAIEAIKGLEEDDLRFLNRLIVERINLIVQARTIEKMASFSAGDRVGFQARDGLRYEGIVQRLNRKTVSVISDDGHRWNVSPALLQLVKRAGS